MSRVAALLMLLAATRASAQGTGTTGSNGVQTCSAGFTAELGVAFPKTPGGTDYQTVSTNFLQQAFGRAECECATTDAIMQVHVTQSIPATMQYGNLEFWVGAGCQTYSTRTNSTTTACENFGLHAPTSFSLPAYPCFTAMPTGCDNSSTYRNVTIPAQALFAPVTHQCGSVAAPTNDVFLIVQPQGQDVMNAQACSLNLTESMQGPPPVNSISVGAGDSAVTLNWTSTAGGAGNPIWSFQVLCADTNGDPIPGLKPTAQAYSVCLSPPGDGGTNGTISRRNTIFQGSGITSLGDMGTTTGTVDAMSEPLSEPLLTTQAVTDDGGTDGGAGTVNKVVFGDPSNAAIDPKYICSDELLAAAATSYSKRITGLKNNNFYQFMVLAIDQWGNVTRSPVLVAEPTPTEDLWRRWYHDTGYSPGFCGVAEPLFIAGDAFLVVLAIGFLATRRRRA